MACIHCHYNGFIETVIIRDGRNVPVIKQCAMCLDTPAYVARIKQAHEECIPKPRPKLRLIRTEK